MNDHPGGRPYCLVKPAAKVELMMFANPPARYPGHVVRSSGSGVSLWIARLMGLVLTLMVSVSSLTLVPCASGDDSTAGDVSHATITDNITDTENLLGASASRVSDAIAQTDQEAGVHVKLLYLDSFNAEKGQQPADWASKLLESTDPKPNTVMLAVASGDCNLVVVVSSNSDDWLRSTKTLDALS